jgi:hypothetical protein
MIQEKDANYGAKKIINEEQEFKWLEKDANWGAKDSITEEQKIG